MVVRTRLRALLVPLVLHAASAATAFYFIQTALNGERGMVAKVEYKKRVSALREQLATLQDDRARWQHRVVLMRTEAVDRDLAEEEARLKLGYVDARDLVIFTDASRRR